MKLTAEAVGKNNQDIYKPLDPSQNNGCQSISMYELPYSSY